MNDGISYQVKKSTTLLGSLQFVVINRCPKYSSEVKGIKKTEIENKLFMVFQKYAFDN